MTKAEFKKILKKEVPSVRFIETDAFGTRTGSQTIHAVFPKQTIGENEPLSEAVKAYVAKANELGYNARNPHCSEIYHWTRVTCLWQKLGEGV